MSWFKPLGISPQDRQRERRRYFRLAKCYARLAREEAFRPWHGKTYLTHAKHNLTDALAVIAPTTAESLAAEPWRLWLVAPNWTARIWQACYADDFEIGSFDLHW